jgi:hypothetical protein
MTPSTIYPRRFTFALQSFLLLIPVIVGCSSPNLPPVSGQLLLDDKPITTDKTKTAIINFHPDSSKGNLAKSIAVASVSETGQYTLNFGGKPGIPEGWYKVTVNYSEPTNPKDPYSTLKQLISGKYSSKDTTPLSVEVKANAPPSNYELKVTK